MKKIEEILDIFYKKKNHKGLMAYEDNKKYGLFYLPFFKVFILDNKDFNEFQKLIDIKLQNKNYILSKDEEILYSKRMQLYAHEYFHFFQTLTLETVQYQSYIMKELTKYEAICFLKSYDNGLKPIFDFKKDRYNENNGLLYLIEKLNDRNLYKQVEEFSEKYEYFNNIWNDNSIEGISLLSIVESMAHIYSLQINNSSDLLNLEDNDIYTHAFNFFLKNFDHKQIDKKWQYIFFLYICYYSLKNYVTYNDKKTNKVIETFIFLSSQMENFLKFISLKQKYFEKLTEKEVDTFLKNKLIFPEQLYYATIKQKISLAAFFETIPIIKTSALKYQSNIQYGKFLDDAFSIYRNFAQKIGFNLDNIYLLANISIFPENFSYLMDLHDKIMNYKDDSVEFDNEQEAEFYFSIIDKCGKLMRKNSEIMCCKKHGFIADKYTILNCKEQDSFATLIKNYLKTDLKELFWVR